MGRYPDVTEAAVDLPGHVVRLSVGATGHRQANPAYAANAQAIEDTLAHILRLVDGTVSTVAERGIVVARTRINTLLVDGTDQEAAHIGHTLGWDVVSPLPFGRRLNAAINSNPETPADARAILAGERPSDPAVAARLAAIEDAAEHAALFELAEQDERVAGLWLATMDAPDDRLAARLFAAETSYRAGRAGRVLLEQSDLLVAVWDGVSVAELGTAGWTVAHALEVGTPVVWIDPHAPSQWRILEVPEALASPRTDDSKPAEAREARLETIVHASILPEPDLDVAHEQIAAARSFEQARWRPASTRLAHSYRRVEALFGGGRRPFRSLVQRYERPDEIATGSGAPFVALMHGLPDVDPALADRVQAVALRGLAFADGTASRLSDAYRGGMTVSFLLSAVAIIAGVLYLPLGMADHKWVFALVEFSMLVAIIAITIVGQRRQWHARWFETRRVAEYFRHSPLMLLVGAARPPRLWPIASGASWPEWFVRHALREIGLPQVKVTGAYLHAALEGIIRTHVVPQRQYHAAKAAHLRHVHHNLDRLSELMFALAVLAVATYLALAAAVAFGLLDNEPVEAAAKLFTVLGVAFPTLGAAIAGIRYFGDFDRFAAISEATAEKLAAIELRASRLIEASPGALDYGSVSALVHAADEVVFSEIESWQSVFGSKGITIPV